MAPRPFVLALLGLLTWVAYFAVAMLRLVPPPPGPVGVVLVPVGAVAALFYFLALRGPIRRPVLRGLAAVGLSVVTFWAVLTVLLLAFFAGL